MKRYSKEVLAKMEAQIEQLLEKRKSLEEKKDHVKARAILVTIGEVGGPRAVEVLTEIVLSVSNPAIIGMAALGLAETGDQSVRPILEKVKEEKGDLYYTSYDPYGGVDKDVGQWTHHRVSYFIDLALKVLDKKLQEEEGDD